MFSTRTNWPLAPNRLAVLLRERRDRGLPILDLTESNPTRCGFELDAEKILAPLNDARALQLSAGPARPAHRSGSRSGVLWERGVHLDPDQIFLTASTSEAYAFVFRLLANAGDNILAPQPSYPLFDFLGGLNDVEVVPYPLVYHDGWQVDLDALASQWESRYACRVWWSHPNNPTGSYLHQRERARMNELCRQNQAAIIADEVFADYALRRGRRSGGDARARLRGADLHTQRSLQNLGAAANEAGVDRRERAAGTAQRSPGSDRGDCGYIPVSQCARRTCRSPVAGSKARYSNGDTRARANESAQARPTAHTRLAHQQAKSRRRAGTLILRVPSTRSDEDWALTILTEAGVFVHPGHFYDFPTEGYLVLSLLPAPDLFEDAVGKIISIVCFGSPDQA